MPYFVTSQNYFLTSSGRKKEFGISSIMIKNKKPPKPYKKGKSKSKKSKKGKRKRKQGIKSTDTFKFVSSAKRSPFQPERWPEDSPAPRRQGQLIREAKKLDKIVQDLKRRIKALPMKNRKVPTSVDPTVLGVELKLRLAAKSPVIVEKTGCGRKVQIERRRADQRFVPLYNINDQSDCRIACIMKLNRKGGTYRRVLKPI